MSRHVEVTLRLYRDTWTFDRKTFGNISGGNGVFLFEITLCICLCPLVHHHSAHDVFI